MAKGMAQDEVLRVKTLVEKSGAQWEVVGPLVKSRGTFRLTIRHTETKRIRLLTSYKQWAELMSAEPNKAKKAAGV